MRDGADLVTEWTKTARFQKTGSGRLRRVELPSEVYLGDLPLVVNKEFRTCNFQEGARCTPAGLRSYDSLADRG